MPEALKNKNTEEVFIFQNNEAPIDQDNWVKADNSEIMERRIIEIKGSLIAARIKFLSSTDFRVLRFIDEGTPYPNEIKTKRILARQEINDIGSCTTLTQLEQFSETFE